MTKLINLLHIVLFAPALFFIASNPSWNISIIAWSLIALSIGVFSHHITHNHWVSWFHVLIVAPLLLTLGLQGQNIHPEVASFTRFIAIAAIAYHSFRLYEKLG